MSLLERVYSFHQDIVTRRYPNTNTLIDRFEISRSTARRDIAYLRDRLMAPLAYDAENYGFYYTEPDFSLPFGDSPKVTLLLGMLNRFAQEAGLSSLPEVTQLEKKLSSMLWADHNQLMKSLYCEWIEVESIDTDNFQVVIEGLVQQQLLAIDYGRTPTHLTSRTIEPQRLCNYQGRWYLLAHCRLRNGLRMFHIARIARARLVNERITFRPELDEYLQNSFGIFKGESPEIAEILFTGTAAELVRHQYWHRDQEFSETDDGLRLKLPISDNREIAMKVLQYGANARVIAPEGLRTRIASEIEAMTTLYKDTGTTKV